MTPSDEQNIGQVNASLSNELADVRADRDKLAARVKELESWIDKGESPTLHETRQRLARVEGALRNCIAELLLWKSEGCDCSGEGGHVCGLPRLQRSIEQATQALGGK